MKHDSKVTSKSKNSDEKNSDEKNNSGKKVSNSDKDLRNSDKLILDNSNKNGSDTPSNSKHDKNKHHGTIIDNGEENTETGVDEQELEIKFNRKTSTKKSCKNWCKSKADDAKKQFDKKSLTFQVCSCLIFFLSMVCSFLCIILVIGVYFMMNLTYDMLDEKIYTSNLENLSREIMGEMDVFKNMSHRFIEKDEWLMKGVLEPDSSDDYPLNWTALSEGIPLFSDFPEASKTSDSNLGDSMVAADQMTYVLVDGNSTNDFELDELKRMNVLNGVWNKINLVRLGYEFDVDVSSTFFMIKKKTSDKQIIATFPGQGITAENFTNYDFYNQAMANTSEYVTIHNNTNPFGNTSYNVIGYCKGFSVGDKYEGVIGIFYNTNLIENLVRPIAEKAAGITYKVYQVNGNQTDIIANTDSNNVIDDGDVFQILSRTNIMANRIESMSVLHENDQYVLTESTSRSRSGAKYKVCGIFGPYYRTNTTEYDFKAIILQNTEVVISFTDSMRDDIYDEFQLVFYLLPVECFGLCALVGIILYIIIYVNVLKPIQQLTKVAQDIKKENNIEDIRELLRNNNLFKQFKQKGYTKEVNVNDEIVNLKKIFYDLFNDESNDHKIDSNDWAAHSHSTKVLTKYDYPMNIYYNEDIKNKLKDISKEKDAAQQPENKQPQLQRTATLAAFSNDSDDDNISKDADDKKNNKAKKHLHKLDIKPPIQIPTEQLLNQLRGK